MNIIKVSGTPKDPHFGHYTALLTNSTGGLVSYAASLNEVRDTPALLGLQIRTSLTKLNPARDQYDFSEIINVAGDLAALTGKVGRLCILIELRSGSATKHAVPAWMRTTEFAGGEFAYSSQNNNTVGGYGIKLYNTNVRLVMEDLAIAMGVALDGIANIELISLTETATGTINTSVTDWDGTGYLGGVVQFVKQLNTYLPSKIIRQMANYPGSQLDELIPDLVESGIAFGWPNTMQDETGLELHQGQYPGIYTYGRTYFDDGVKAAEVQKPDYLNSALDGSGYEPTVQQLLAFLKTEFNVHYVIWTRVMDICPATGNPIWNDVLALLNQTEQLKECGGLNPALPVGYLEAWI